MTAAPLVLKLGGELLEQPRDISRIARGVAAMASRAGVIVVHGGGREVDAALASAGIKKIQIDGLRVTDAATLNVVVAVLAGAVNTRLVAALRRTPARAVGLTAVDADVATMKRFTGFRDSRGRAVSLGLVGAPVGTGRPMLLLHLLAGRYVPVVACIGVSKGGQVLNVNADTLAAHLAVALGARRLVIAGGTTGVLDVDGSTIGRLDARSAGQLISSGTANAGMVAKLEACRAALRGGVKDVLIVNGRRARLGMLAEWKGSPRLAAGTQVVP